MINESYNSEHAKTEAMNSQHTRCLKEKELYNDTILFGVSWLSGFILSISP